MMLYTFIYSKFTQKKRFNR